jgi:hypothetical protein
MAFAMSRWLAPPTDAASGALVGAEARWSGSGMGQDSSAGRQLRRGAQSGPERRETRAKAWGEASRNMAFPPRSVNSLVGREGLHLRAEQRTVMQLQQIIVASPQPSYSHGDERFRS